jgi:CO/xanthine dehydrogenase Mo-binding subunit
MSNISESIPKIDASVKISGSALYTADIKKEHLLYAKTIRSSIPRGTFKISYPPLPEGYFVVDYHDVPGKNIVKIIFEDMPFFAENEVQHIGEPIALLVGPVKEVILQLIQQVQIDYTPLEPILDDSLSVIHYAFTKGSPSEMFEKASKVITRTYSTGYQEQAYIEPQGFICYPEDGGKITLVGSIQCPYYVKNAVLQALDYPQHLVRVIQPAVGGAFGGKEEFPSIMACQIAVAVHKIKQPIQLIYERMEDIICTTKRHPSTIQMTGYVDPSNQLLGIKAHVSLFAGAFIGLSGVVLSRAMIASSGAYTIPHLDISGDVYKTNTVPTGAFRGFGAPQMLFAIEMFMHHIPLQLGIDPFTFRKRYLAKQGDKTSTSGTFRDLILLPELIDCATKKANYFEKVVQYSSKNLYKGIGMSYFLHGCGFTGSGESTHIHAKVKLEKTKENIVKILIASVDMGQGIQTSMIKIVSSILDIPLHQVTFDYPDTDYIVDSGPTVASRTVMIVGGLCARAARILKEQWMDQTHQIVYQDYEQPTYMKWDESTFQGDAYPAYSWGVNIVEVEVDPHTYQVKVEHITSAYDVGKAIDERIVLGQIEGGQAQGVAYGYLEVMEEKGGAIRQQNLTDYIIPTAMDMPTMESELIDNPYPLGPYGAKGAGELTLVGGAPAVALAIQMAIKKEITAIPATPEMIARKIAYE